MPYTKRAYTIELRKIIRQLDELKPAAESLKLAKSLSQARAAINDAIIDVTAL